MEIPASEAIEHLVGMQAQAPLAPYIGLWTRLADFRPVELVDLIETRTAVRANGMLRMTIHLVTARDAQPMRSMLEPVADRAFAASPFARNIDGVDVAEVRELGRALLEERPLTVAEMGTRLRERWPDRDGPSLAYATRYLLPTVQVPPRGLWGRSGQSKMAPMDSWLGGATTPRTGEVAPDAFVLRYLRAFGPASGADIRTWSGLTGVREILERLRPQLRTFRDERGRELFDVPDAPLPDPDVPAPVRFFPEYDNVLLSHDDRTRIIPEGREWYLGFPPGNGGLRGTFTVDGFLAGMWRLVRPPARESRDGAQATLLIATNETLSTADRADVEAEAEALGQFLAPDGRVAVQFAAEPFDNRR
ncbi:MAG TPA: winged helix DNA-binding domain-containing protein [Candidatus Limnocylindrales bacterium]